MKLTKSKLKQLIKEELQNVLKEDRVEDNPFDQPGGATSVTDICEMLQALDSEHGTGDRREGGAWTYELVDSTKNNSYIEVKLTRTKARS
jgi:hypothetical protein